MLGCLFSATVFSPVGPASDWLHSVAAGPAGECNSAGSQPVSQNQWAAEWGRYNPPGRRPSSVISSSQIRHRLWCANDEIGGLSHRCQTGRTTCCCPWCCVCVSAWCCLPTAAASPLCLQMQSQSLPYPRATPTAVPKGGKTSGITCNNKYYKCDKAAWGGWIWKIDFLGITSTP